MPVACPPSYDNQKCPQTLSDVQGKRTTGLEQHQHLDSGSSAFDHSRPSDTTSIYLSLSWGSHLPAPLPRTSQQARRSLRTESIHTHSRQAACFLAFPPTCNELFFVSISPLCPFSFLPPPLGYKVLKSKNLTILFTVLSLTPAECQAQKTFMEGGRSGKEEREKEKKGE